MCATIARVSVPAPDPPLTEVERWLYQQATPERLSSARAAYELMPSQSDRQLPFVYVPYDPRSEAHWAAAARVADFAAHAPEATAGRSVHVLDVGPGDGWPSLPLAAARPDFAVVGVDPSPLRTEVCAHNARRLALPNARFLTADAARLPFRDAAFDCAVASHSLEEADAPGEVFAELARVLRPGGTLRVAYQDWRLRVPEFETVLLWGGRLPVDARRGRGGGERVLLYTYARRVQEPALERRYTLLLPDDGEAARLHADALLVAARAPRAYGETLLEGARSALGVPLLRRLAPLARRSTVVELRRWSTGWLVKALRSAGFADVRATAHPGELARQVARGLLARDAIETVAPAFAEVAAAVGVAAGSLAGDGMVLAVR